MNGISLKNLSKSPRQSSIRLLILKVAFAVLGFAGASLSFLGGAWAEPKASQKPVDVKLLEGRWLRPDGGYILELRGLGRDGSLSAAYFNPRPIKVYQGVWTRQGGKIAILVELRDVNYPGSTYNLEYEPKSDRLKGTYFQAVERQTYDVQFMRTK